MGSALPRGILLRIKNNGPARIPLESPRTFPTATEYPLWVSPFSPRIILRVPSLINQSKGHTRLTKEWPPPWGFGRIQRIILTDLRPPFRISSSNFKFFNLRLSHDPLKVKIEFPESGASRTELNGTLRSVSTSKRIFEFYGLPLFQNRMREIISLVTGSTQIKWRRVQNTESEWKWTF
jgi:hypothetical protein